MEKSESHRYLVSSQHQLVSIYKITPWTRFFPVLLPVLKVIYDNNWDNVNHQLCIFSLYTVIRFFIKNVKLVSALDSNETLSKQTSRDHPELSEIINLTATNETGRKWTWTKLPHLSALQWRSSMSFDIKSTAGYIFFAMSDSLVRKRKKRERQAS